MIWSSSFIRKIKKPLCDVSAELYLQSKVLRDWLQCCRNLTFIFIIRYQRNCLMKAKIVVNILRLFLFGLFVCNLLLLHCFSPLFIILYKSLVNKSFFFCFCLLFGVYLISRYCFFLLKSDLLINHFCFGFCLLCGVLLISRYCPFLFKSDFCCFFSLLCSSRIQQ